MELFGRRDKTIWGRWLTEVELWELNFDLISLPVRTTCMCWGHHLQNSGRHTRREKRTCHSSFCRYFLFNCPYWVRKRCAECLSSRLTASLAFWPVFSFGSAEKGQLGTGTTGERITTGNKTTYDIEVDPGVYFCFLCVWDLFWCVSAYIKEFDGKKIIQIASGQQHSLALEETGYWSLDISRIKRLKYLV